MKRLLEFFLFLTLLSVVSCSKNHEIACIDDSDCVKLGHKYSCFLYYCHNWVDQDPLRPHCQADWQCGEEHKCFRHWNLREVDNGICLSNYQVKTCDVHSDCHEGDHCCGMYCCSQHYYKQWEEFACFSDMQCRSWKTGNYCCNNNLCCDDRKVEIQAFGIDTDLQTNEIPGVSYESVATEVPLTTTMHDLRKDSDTFGEDGAESQVNSVIVEPTATAAHDTIEITTPDSPEDTTLVDKTVIIKDTITVNVSSYDLYQTNDEGDTTIDTSITERVVGHTGINKLNETSLSTLGEISSTDKITDEISVTTNDDETTTKNIPTDSTLHVSALMDSSEEDVEEDDDIITTPSTTTTTTTTTTNKPTTRRQIKQQRPKNKYVMPHRFPSSGSSLQSWCTSAIKSIVLMYIQLKMISNSFSSC